MLCRTCDPEKPDKKANMPPKRHTSEKNVKIPKKNTVNVETSTLFGKFLDKTC